MNRRSFIKATAAFLAAPLFPKWLKPVPPATTPIEPAFTQILHPKSAEGYGFIDTKHYYRAVRLNEAWIARVENIGFTK